MDENQELELNEEIKNIKSSENFNNALNLQLENAFKESVFEFRIIGLVLNNKEEQKIEYEERKKRFQIWRQKYYFMAQE